ncbi:MAG: hypothetical protein AB7Q16_17950 [Vicinamibacterales bacterium]
MPRHAAFQSLRTDAAARQARQAAAETAEAEAVDAVLHRLVACLPTQAAFDAWVATFPAEYQADIRLRFAASCTFPRTTHADADATPGPR